MDLLTLLFLLAFFAVGIVVGAQCNKAPKWDKDSIALGHLYAMHGIEGARSWFDPCARHRRQRHRLQVSHVYTIAKERGRV